MVEWPKLINKRTRLHIKVILLLVYASTRYIGQVVDKNISSVISMEVFDTIFSRNGLTSFIVLDNISLITSEMFQSYLAEKQIDHVSSLAYLHSFNGQSECSVGSIKNGLRKTSGSVNIY